MNIYYKSKKTCNLIIKKNLTATPSDSAKHSQVVYIAECLIEDCELRNSFNIGIQLTLSTPNAVSRKKEAILQLYKSCHSIKPCKNDILKIIPILFTSPNIRHLKIYEALNILQQSPSHNRQNSNHSRTVKSSIRRYHTTKLLPKDSGRPILYYQVASPVHHYWEHSQLSQETTIIHWKLSINKAVAHSTHRTLRNQSISPATHLSHSNKIILENERSTPGCLTVQSAISLPTKKTRPILAK